MSDRLKEAAQRALEFIDLLPEDLGRGSLNGFKVQTAYALRSALAASADAGQQEPVAWRVRGYAQFKTGRPGAWRYFDQPTKPNVQAPDCCDFEPLYATPAPAQADPKETT